MAVSLKKQIAIIPARGGSKRLPRKNILPLLGKPLLARVIETVRESKVFDSIIVSSDDDEVLEVAATSGAIAYRRPRALGQDRATVVQVCLDALSKYNCENFCCIYATAVLLKSGTINRSSRVFSDLSEADANVLMGVSKYNYHPVKALAIQSDGSARLIFADYQNMQSQFYPEVRVSNGTFYWGRKDTFEKEQTFYSARLKLMDVSESEVCDLDTADDYKELVSRFRK